MVVTERDQEKVSDELWNLSTECEKELTAKEAFHEFGRDELVGRVGTADVGSSENLEDLGRTKNGEEQLRQILALRKERTNSKWDLVPMVSLKFAPGTPRKFLQV